MSWAIQVENVSKQYRMGAAVTPALDSLYQMIEQKLSGITRRMGRSRAQLSLPVHHETTNTSAHLVLTPEQQEGCPEGHFWALHDVTFEVKEGERVGIVGKNGSGKSTLLKILSRITIPTKGQFRFRGRLVSLLEVGTGFHPDLSGRENIILNAKINGMSSRGIRRIFDQIVEFSELGRQIDTPIKRYSSGMYMRLAFSVAAHLESDILIVDEVLAVGDAGFQKKCMDKMLQISGKGRTLLFVSHDMNAISSLCTKALELSHGRVASLPQQNSTITTNDREQSLQNANGLRSVNQAISDYVLEKGAVAEKIWDSEKAPAMDNKNVTLRRVAVVNQSGVVTNKFSINSNINIVIDFKVLSNKWKLNCHVYLTTLTGQRLFVSMDNLDVKPIIRNLGEIREICTIPSPYLNEGTYRVTVVICTNPTTEHYIAVHDVTCFDVCDDAGPLSGVRGDWVREWPDYPLRPRFSWSIDHNATPPQSKT